jgi:hypothetical protein
MFQTVAVKCRVPAVSEYICSAFLVGMRFFKQFVGCVVLVNWTTRIRVEIL